MTRRSDCPISNVLDFVGDKWSLLIIRDLLFFGKKSYSELISSDEQIASNILSSRLGSLEKGGLITKQVDINDKRKKIYALTQKGKDMLPIMLEMMIWSSKYDPSTNASERLIVRAKTDRNNLISDLLAIAES